MTPRKDGPARGEAAIFNRQVPLVTIGLPVHNGMPLLVRALESLQAQDLDGLEIIVSDNASDDGTEAYCREVAGRDSRVRYSRNAENVGAAANFALTFSLSRSQYFAWAAHDDWYEPNFASTCLAALQDRPGAGLCVPAHRRVDEVGRVVSIRREPTGLAASDLGTRLRAHLWRRGWLTIYGLWRSELLRRIGPPPPVFGSDVVLVWKALLLAPAETIDTPLGDYRVVRGKSADSVLSGLTGLPQMARFGHSGMVSSLHRASLESAPNEADRRVADRVLWRWVLSHHYRELVATDLIEESRRLRAKGAVLRAAAVLGPAALLGPRMALRQARRTYSSRCAARQ